MKCTIIVILACLLLPSSAVAADEVDPPAPKEGAGPTTEPAPAAPTFDESEVIEAAKVMGVSADRAREDLTLQYEAHGTIGELIDAGDQVWMDNKPALIHVYGDAKTRKAIPASVEGHIVHDATPRESPAIPGHVTPTSCSSKKTGYQFCTPLQAGVEIEHWAGAHGAECTAGFMVRDYSGNPGMLTAAHCATWGTTFYSNPALSRIWKSLAVCEPGPWITGVSPWSGYDAALYPVNGCGGVTPSIRDFGKNKTYPQEGATNTQYVGEYVCQYGQHSLHQCGEQIAVNVVTEVDYTGNGSHPWVIQETDVACGLSLPGDSGGPIASGVYKGDATGILIAGGPSGACPEGNIWIEQRIFALLELFNVYVAT